MQWTFRILAGLNSLLLALAFFDKPTGEDPAGEGMRLAFALFYAVALAVVAAVYHLIKKRWVRVTMLAILTLPLISILYGIWLSVPR